MIDLTTLEGADTPGKVRSPVRQGPGPRPDRPDHPAAGRHLRLRRHGRHGQGGPRRQRHPRRGRRHGLPVAAARACRSSSPTPRDAVEAGADEIDMVIDRGAFLAGDYLTVFNADRRGQGRVCGDAPTSRSSWRPASWSPTTTSAAPRGCRCSAAATSSRPPPARSQPAATLPVTLVMLEAVRDWREPHRREVGVKPAGGIRTTKDAIKYLVMVNEIAGEDWLDTALVPLRRLEPAQRPAPAAPEARAPAPTPAPTT